MKIIKEGKLPELEVFQAECSHCKCVVEFLRQEAKYESHRNEGYLSVNCPTEGCNNTITLDLTIWNSKKKEADSGK